MSRINYNHLYYFWHIYKEGSVVGTTEALYLTPQTITGQIRALEKRLQGKLFKREKHGLKPSGLEGLVCRYAGKTFALGQKILDIVNYREESNLLFDVGVADALSERPISSVLDIAVVKSEQTHLRCLESAHEILLEQLSQHKLDMIISDCPIDSTQQEGLFSMKIGEYGVSFWCTNPLPEKSFPACLKERHLLIPGYHSMLGYKLLSWFNSQGLNVEILGKFDDAALIRAFGATHSAILVAPSLYTNDFYSDDSVVEIGRVENVTEEYRAVFAERVIRHPTVQRIHNTDYSALFTPASR